VSTRLREGEHIWELLRRSAIGASIDVDQTAAAGHKFMKKKVWFRDSAHAQQTFLNLALALGVIGFLVVLGATLVVAYRS
jgi:hypothetical protein